MFSSSPFLSLLQNTSAQIFHTTPQNQPICSLALTISMATDQDRSFCCFKEWMNLQHEDLSELLKALSMEKQPSNDSIKEGESSGALKSLTEKSLKHFQEYMDKRSKLAEDDVTAFYAPNWCNALEKSVLWIAGCRPSIYIRLIYALTGSEMEGNLEKFLQGRNMENLHDLSTYQMVSIDQLQRKTIREEEKLTSQMASFQEEIADRPIALIADRSKEVGETNEEVEKALDKHEVLMVGVLKKADKLRMSTLKEILKIMTPKQAVEFLAAGKKLHLCLHEWGKKRDQKHGRT